MLISSLQLLLHNHLDHFAPFGCVFFVLVDVLQLVISTNVLNEETVVFLAQKEASSGMLVHVNDASQGLPMPVRDIAIQMDLESPLLLQVVEGSSMQL